MYGLGTLRLQPLGYNVLTGGANYYQPSASDQATVITGPGQLQTNCVGAGGQAPTDLPADGEKCFMLEFPFVGTKQYGCGSEVIQGAWGNPYVECKPVILAGGGFDFISPLLRVGITSVIAWLLFRRVF